MHSTKVLSLKWRVIAELTREQGRAKTWISPLRCGTTGILQASLQVQIQGLSSHSDRRVLEPHTETGRKGSVKAEKQCTLTSPETSGSQGTGAVYVAVLHGRGPSPSRERRRDQRGLPAQEATWPASQGGSPWKIWDGNLAFLSLPMSQSKICGPVALVSRITY